MAELHIDAPAFWKKLNNLTSLWKERPFLFCEATCLCFAIGKWVEDAASQQLPALQEHLFGLEFPETILLLYPKKLLVFSSPKRCGVLKEISVGCPEGFSVTFEECPLKEEDANLRRLQALVASIKSSAGEGPPVRVGILEKESENLQGTFSKVLLSIVRSQGIQTVDISKGMSDYLNPGKGDAPDGAISTDKQEADEDNGDEEEEEVVNWAEKLRNRKGDVKTISEHRDQLQQEIFERKQRESENRSVTREMQKKDFSTAGRLARGQVSSYASEKELPGHALSTAELRIMFDDKKDSVLIPIGGSLVPFHVCTLKNVALVTIGEFPSLRFNFCVPVGGAGAYVPGMMFPESTFLKELTYRCRSVATAEKWVTEINSSVKRLRQHESTQRESEGVVKQPTLQASGPPISRLKDVYIRPTLKGKKSAGFLDAYPNGFKFTAGSAAGGQSVEILHANIAQAIFQPADNETLVLVHFHLKSPIILGARKTVDVQFYAEVMEEFERINNASVRERGEEIERAEEERHHALVKRINTEFFTWTKKIEALKFEIPIRHQEFGGTVNRSSVTVRRTPGCLVSLVEAPFFVLALDDVEVCVLERVIHGQKNFDMVFVLKDYTQPVQRVDMVEMRRLDPTKDWLTEKGIKYYECRQPLAWPQIMKEIIKDDQNGVWRPWSENKKEGWASFLDTAGGDDSSDSEENTDSEDENFNLEDADESSSSSSDSDSDFDEDEEEEEDDDEDEEGNDEEGLSWDELEAKAAQEDRENHGSGDEDSDSDSDRARRKPKPKPKPKPAAGAPPPPPPPPAPQPRRGGL
eukprot:RCo034322